jgi:hypothetical protein
MSWDDINANLKAWFTVQYEMPQLRRIKMNDRYISMLHEITKANMASLILGSLDSRVITQICMLLKSIHGELLQEINYYAACLDFDSSNSSVPYWCKCKQNQLDLAQITQKLMSDLKLYSVNLDTIEEHWIALSINSIQNACVQ